MKNKKLAVFMAMTMLTASVGLTANAAASSTASENSTEVKIGVTTKKPAQMSITVPTVMAIAVTTDASGNANGTLVGNYMVDGSGNVSVTEDAATDYTKSQLPFKNSSDDGSGNGVAVKLTGATIDNETASKWTIKDMASIGSAAYEIGIKIGADANASDFGTSAGIKPGEKEELNFTTAQTLTANATTKIPFAVKAGTGTSGNNYGTGNVASAKAFSIVWTIEEAGN